MLSSITPRQPPRSPLEHIWDGKDCFGGQKISICQKNFYPIFCFQYMNFWTHKIFLAIKKNFFEYYVGVKNAKNRRNLCPAISQQPIIRFSQDFACNTSFTWAKRHEASFGSDCCLPDKISKRRYIASYIACILLRAEYWVSRYSVFSIFCLVDSSKIT